MKKHFTEEQIVRILREFDADRSNGPGAVSTA
jgi:hypothetical protein